ncbi:MAG TPA: isoprenylcysteine carboxylmethyltransferase family protein [Pseudomonadales bacterium]
MALKIPPPLIVLFAALMMWLTPLLGSWGQFAGSWQKPMALLLLAAGMVLFVGAVAVMLRARTTINPMHPDQCSALVTRGVFGLSRNPIYLADLLLLSAWWLWLGYWPNILWLVFFVLYLNVFQIEPEEKALRQAFGETYLRYCRRVRRWI